MTLIDPFDALQGGPDLEVIAQDIINDQKRRKKTVPTDIDLVRALTGVNIKDTIIGSSTLTLTIKDEDFILMDSGYFDADENGKLDPIQLQYGTNSVGDPQWWRITQCNPAAKGVIQLIFMERGAVYMQEHIGPLKTSRAKSTRAEFIGNRLVGAIKKGGGLNFHSHDLDKKQPTKKDDPKEIKKQKKDRERAVTKSQGINSNEDLKINGKKATPEQLAVAETMLDEATRLDAPELAVQALMCAGIGESEMTENTGGGTGGKYVGPLQGQPKYFKPTDVRPEAHYFLVGGKGYGGGGAIAQANAHPDKDPGLIAADTEVSYPNQFLPNAAAATKYYGKHIDEAKALIAAYGGGSFSGTSYTKQFNFQVGTEQDPHEDFWEGANRLADEVKWPFFMDGDDVYYDPETTLIKQKPVAVIFRDDPAVLDWNVTWDNRHIATEMTIQLVCDPFQFRAGTVFKMMGFGAASTGSTAKLPGRWLIQDIERDRSNLWSEFTLKQPTKPSPEPKAETAQRDTATADDTSPIDGKQTPKELIDTIVLPIARENGIHVTPASVTAANARHGHTVRGTRSDHEGPPAVAWAADMGNGWLTDQELALAKALCKRFDIKFVMGTIMNGSDGTFRYQIIYGANIPGAGEHRNHVHFGAHRIGA